MIKAYVRVVRTSTTGPKPKIEMPVAMMPLRKNVPNPEHSDWELTTCPECGNECWKMGETAKTAERFFPEIRFLCTECALKWRASERPEGSP